MNQENDKTILNYLIENIEQKLSSVDLIHQKLFQLIIIIQQTNQNIQQELNQIKNIIQLNKTKIQSTRNDEQQSTHSIDRLSLFSPNSFNSSSTNSLIYQNRPNSSTTKRSSNLKQLSTIRPKSPKSVTFNIDQQEKEKEKEEENVDLITNLFEQHHNQVINEKDIGFKLGKYVEYLFILEKKEIVIKIKSALTNIRIHEIESINGDYLRLLNLSNSDDYDLSEHFIQQNISCVPISRFKFPLNTIIRAGQTVTIWCGLFKDIQPQPPHIFVWKDKKRWEIGAECVTILSKPTGQAIAWARSSNKISSDQSSSDILFVHSKSNVYPSNVPSIRSRSRLSGNNYIGNSKSILIDSSSLNGDDDNIIISTNDIRSQRNILNRPKSSPFSSHNGSKQDSISMNYLTNQQIRKTK